MAGLRVALGRTADLPLEGFGFPLEEGHLQTDLLQGIEDRSGARFRAVQAILEIHDLAVHLLETRLFLLTAGLPAFRGVVGRVRAGRRRAGRSAPGHEGERRRDGATVTWRLSEGASAHQYLPPAGRRAGPAPSGGCP